MNTIKRSASKIKITPAPADSIELAFYCRKTDKILFKVELPGPLWERIEYACKKTGITPDLFICQAVNAKLDCEIKRREVAA